MKLVDTNVLVYAVYRDSPYHFESVGWLDSTLTRREPVGFAWLALVAFVRLTTNPKISSPPLSPEKAMDYVSKWLAALSTRILHPGSRHTEYFLDALKAVPNDPNLVNDAHLAAIAREHRATIISFDSDFGLFPSIKWERPRR